MADPTFAQAMDMYAKVVHFAEEHKKFLTSNSDNFIGMEDALEAVLKGDYVSDITAALAGVRSSHGSALLQVGSVLDPVLDTIGKAIGSNRSGINIYRDWFEYMRTASTPQYVNSRELDFGEPAPQGTEGSESLSETDFATHAKWDVTGDFDDTGGNGAYTHSAGSGTLTQTDGGNLAIDGVAKKWYKFVYTISSPSGDATLQITTSFALVAQTLSTTAGTHTLYFQASDNPTDFVISGTSTSGGITIDDLSLKEIGNVGSGPIYRLTKDAYNFDIEAIPATSSGAVWEAEVTADENSGTRKGEETITVRYQDNSRDSVDYEVPRAEISIDVANPDNGLGITNPSFAELDGTEGAPTTIPGWTWDGDVATDLELDSTNYYVASPVENDGTPRALKIKDNGNLSQKLSLNNLSLSPFVPYFCMIFYNREVGSGSGTLTLHLGSKTTAVSLGSETGWRPLLVPSAPGQNCWFENFNEADLDIVIQMASISGTVLVDHLIFQPFDEVFGSWLKVVQGQTNFQRGDLFTFTDTVSAEAILQYWTWRFFGPGAYLPHITGGSETISDP
ncbi:MAG: hypothetical protein KDD43_00085 [Bdellovibrionales bacterium]|nr:hypothetical protein [Bdellovibrionales bacterium]